MGAKESKQQRDVENGVEKEPNEKSGAIKRIFRIADPRSPSTGLDRTPILVEKPSTFSTEVEHSGQMLPVAVPTLTDPRSPSTEIERTPIFDLKTSLSTGTEINQAGSCVCSIEEKFDRIEEEEDIVDRSVERVDTTAELLDAILDMVDEKEAEEDPDEIDITSDLFSDITMISDLAEPPSPFWIGNQVYSVVGGLQQMSTPEYEREVSTLLSCRKSLLEETKEENTYTNTLMTSGAGIDGSATGVPKPMGLVCRNTPELPGSVGRAKVPKVWGVAASSTPQPRSPLVSINMDDSPRVVLKVEGGSAGVSSLRKRPPMAAVGGLGNGGGRQGYSQLVVDKENM